MTFFPVRLGVVLNKHHFFWGGGLVVVDEAARGGEPRVRGGNVLSRA